MNKKIILISIVLMIVLIVGMVFIFTKNTQAPQTALSSTTNTTKSSNTQDQTQEEPKKAENSAGRYIAYSTNEIAKDTGTKILFFHAPWCPQCRALDSDISKNIANDQNVTIYKVDYDTNQELRKKYGVTLQTTLVKIDDSGNLLKKYVAYQDPTYANVKANVY